MHAAAVLFSGGLDSTVLLASELSRSAPVWPVHVRAGLAWEAGEHLAIDRLLAATPFSGRAEPLITLSVDMTAIYSPSHWAVSGHPPAYDTPDQDVYLEGRNIGLIAQASILCRRIGATRLVLGPLAGNPFPDATDEFFSAMAHAVSLGLGRALEIAAPFRHLHKEQVIALGLELGVPLSLTLSCMDPTGTAPCGRCSKCRERRDAFTLAGISDGTQP
jgi:7-cyano-7-deazaguanine synthase